jgi:hypothetical protein
VLLWTCLETKMYWWDGMRVEEDGRRRVEREESLYRMSRERGKRVSRGGRVVMEESSKQAE